MHFLEWKCIVWISIRSSLKCVPKGTINNIPSLVQIMAWCRPGDKPLSEPMMVNLLTYIWFIRPHWLNGNYVNPVYGVAIICQQLRRLRWGHPSLFHIATVLLIWFKKMFCMRDIAYRLIWMKFINMLSVYAQSGTHKRVNWRIIAVLT